MALGLQLPSLKISMALFRTSNGRWPESLYRLAADTFRVDGIQSRGDLAVLDNAVGVAVVNLSPASVNRRPERLYQST